jgi:hypothetical protein
MPAFQNRFAKGALEMTKAERKTPKTDLLVEICQTPQTLRQIKEHGISQFAVHNAANCGRIINLHKGQFHLNGLYVDATKVPDSYKVDPWFVGLQKAWG